MELNKNLEAIIVALLYLTTIYFWTLPIQKNKMPYGEVDAASHYAVADYTYKSDSSITTLPYYIDKRYGQDNKFKPHALWYPPPFHTALAVAAVFGGSSDVPIYIANAIFSSLIVLSVYFIIRKFFGFEAALLSGLLIAFSMRDIMVYLWGQWPERMGFAYLPLVIYCFYKYCASYLANGEKPIYLYIMALLLSINFFIHPMDFFHSAAALIIIGLFFLIKERRLFFGIRHASAAIVIFLLVISIFPLQTMNVVVRSESEGSGIKSKGDISRLFYWIKQPAENVGLPSSYFSYREMIGPYWTIPLILLGVLFLLLRRDNKCMVILGWLVSLYIMVHLDFIGKGRVHRSLSGTAHIFYPLMALGIIYLSSFIPGIKGLKQSVRYGLIAIFVIFALVPVGIEANNALKESYQGILRVNPYQYELIEWLRSSIPEDAGIYHAGAISLAKTRWLWMMGNRFIVSSAVAGIKDYNVTYAIEDYSDFSIIGDQNSISKLQEWGRQNLADSTLIYDKNYIRVYKLED